MQLSEIFESHHVPYRMGGEHHHVRHRWIGVDCPKCSPGSGRYRLGFEQAGRRTHCWMCGGMEPVRTLAIVCGISEREAARFWARRGYFAPDKSALEHTGVLQIPKGIGDLLPVHMKYLRRRGFDPHRLQDLWSIRGIGIAARLQWRIYIPIFDINARQVSWTTRAISKEQDLRYISAKPEEESVPHKNILYGSHLSRSTVIVCEGPLDAWAIGPGAVATLGIGCTEAQMALIADYPLRVICFDSDDDAQRRADEVCAKLSMFPGQTENLILQSGGDPAEADPAEIASIREEYGLGV